MTTAQGAPDLVMSGPARFGRLLLASVFLAGALVGLLSGLIGLGGAEFRLPLLISVFGFVALQAVILNKATSLAVVLTALPARLAAVPLAVLAPTWPIGVNLLAGSLAGPGSAPPGPRRCAPRPCTSCWPSCSW